jgi:RHS repeat-associated protein
MQARGREIKILSGHTDLIGQIAFSPNGQQLLSESRDQTARLWNVSTGTQLLVTRLNERGAAVAFSPSGELFAVATQPVYGLPPKSIVGVYDSHTGELLRDFPRCTNVVTSIAFSSDDQTLAIAGGNASGSLIEVWGSSRLEPKITVPAKGREINVITFSKDGHLLASGGYWNGQGFVEVNGLEANGIIRSFKVGGDVMSLDFSSEGTKLVVGTNKGQITLLTLQSRWSVSQQFTLKECDSETGLDYFGARYYSSQQGRFTSPDEFTGGPDELYYFVDDGSENPTFYADLFNPQWYIDPDGHDRRQTQSPKIRAVAAISKNRPTK